MYRLYCERDTEHGHVVTVEQLPMAHEANEYPRCVGLMLRDRQVLLTAQEAKDIGQALLVGAYEVEWRD